VKTGELRLMAWLCVAWLAQSCGGDPAAPLPSPGPEHTHIMVTVGTPVSATLNSRGGYRVFDVIAPASGVLTVHLSWDPRDVKLDLEVGDTLLTSSPPDWSPLVAQLCVAVNRMYRIRVLDQAAWDYGTPGEPFILTTAVSDERPCSP
jgi:hypothetical protein